MSDYDATPRKKKQPIYYIHGQSEQLCRDVHAADEAGVSYGVYMGWKADKEEQDYYKKFGVRKRRKS